MTSKVESLEHGNGVPGDAKTKLFGDVVHLGAECGKIRRSAQCVTAALRWETAHKNSRSHIQHPRPNILLQSCLLCMNSFPLFQHKVRQESSPEGSKSPLQQWSMMLLELPLCLLTPA